MLRSIKPPGARTVVALGVVAFVSATPAAHADYDRDDAELKVRPVQIDLALGVSLGYDSHSVSPRAYVGYARPLARTSRHGQYFAGLGLHLSRGFVQVGTDHSRVRTALGPELRAGWAYGSGYTDVYVFGALTPLVTSPSYEGGSRGDGDWILGGRAAVGFGGPGSWTRDNDSGTGEDYSSDLYMLMPNTLELFVEHSRARDGPRNRYGLAWGYAF